MLLRVFGLAPFDIVLLLVHQFIFGGPWCFCLLCPRCRSPGLMFNVFLSARGERTWRAVPLSPWSPVKFIYRAISPYDPEPE